MSEEWNKKSSKEIQYHFVDIWKRLTFQGFDIFDNIIWPNILKYNWHVGK